jgi:hypothetical protein
MKSAVKQIAITAIVVVLVSGVGVPYAKKHLINGKQIKKGTITGKQVKFPAAHRVSLGARAGARKTSAFGGNYVKGDPNSVLQVTWSGTASADFSPCLYTLTVDGKQAPGGGGQAYVQNSQTVNVSVQALFPGLAVGPHDIAISGVSINAPGVYPCALGGYGIDTTVNAAELVQ